MYEKEYHKKEKQLLKLSKEIKIYCISNTNSPVDFNWVLGDYDQIFPNAALAGDVYVGEYYIMTPEVRGIICNRQKTLETL